jgi:hypothetical protein
MSLKHLLVAVLSAFAIAGVAHGQLATSGAVLPRPDVTMWPTLGTTVRVDRMNPTIPAQMRQILIEPSAYRHLIETGAYPDGAMFAALFHSVGIDTSYAPPLYHAAGDELVLAIEVIDRSHPDGRRFYTYARDATSATAMAPANECAVCHNTQGSFDGTFAHLYQGAARFAPARE